MNNYKHILIAVDLSKESDTLLEKAKHLSNEMTTFSLIHAIHPVQTTYFGSMPYVPSMLNTKDIEDKILEAKKQQCADLFETHKLTKADWRIVVGKPSTVIKEFAEENSCDLILLGSHAEKGVRALLGSTATGVLHDAPCDVLAVRIFS